jgi:hypothetical protein
VILQIKKMDETVRLPLLNKTLWLLLEKYTIERDYRLRIQDTGRYIEYKFFDIASRFLKTMPKLHVALSLLPRYVKPKVCFKNDFTVKGVNVQCNRGGILRDNVESKIRDGGPVKVLCCSKHLDELISVSAIPKFINHVKERISREDPEEYYVYVYKI